MAKELTIVTSAEAVLSNGETWTVPLRTQQIDVTGTKCVRGTTQTFVAGVEEAIDLGTSADTAVGGVWKLKNRNPIGNAGYIGIRAATGQTSLIELRAQEEWIFRQHRDSAAPFAMATTANVDLDVERLPP
jgi:hypothetical protein